MSQHEFAILVLYAVKSKKDEGVVQCNQDVIAVNISQHYIFHLHSTQSLTSSDEVLVVQCNCNQDVTAVNISQHYTFHSY